MSQWLQDVIAANRAGQIASIPSVCSAHRDVLRAAMLLPEGQGKGLLIEATSNQVNQEGGYTGMIPADFVTYVHDIATKTGFDKSRIILGGDHLGPQAWKDQPADMAMEKARAMVAAYVKAGFTKIHLDCSEGCQSEPAHLDDTIVAARAAELADVCERNAPKPEMLNYIIGTEVPVPGGGRAGHAGIKPTDPSAAIATMEAHLKVFPASAARRIVGLVVQPGVEFGATEIDHLPMQDKTGLRAALNSFPNVTYEAHSTDYQHPAAYERLAGMGFAIHKVGPALTFAYRRAIYALDHIRSSLIGKSLRVSAILEAEMCADPKYWQGHYTGDAQSLRILRHFGFSDRIRYYWPRPAVVEAVRELKSDLENADDPPHPLLLQYFSPAVLDRAGRLPDTLTLVDRLIAATVQEALAPYNLVGAK